MFFLHCADFFPNLEERLFTIISAESERTSPLPRQRLIVVPTSAIRKKILTMLAIRRPESLRNVEIFSINQLAIQIVLDASTKPKRLISDPLFFPFALYQLARTKDIPRFSNFRTCLALYQTLRDLSDGAVTSGLLDQVVQESRQDPDLDFVMKSADAASLIRIYSEFEQFVRRNHLLNLQMPSAAAAELADDWITAQNPSALVLYGFYDSTETQLEILDKLIRYMHRNERDSHFLFPFRVDWNNEVEHPAKFAQPFFDRIRFLTSALNGKMETDSQQHRLASGGVETLLFAGPADSEIEAVRNASNIEVFHAGGVYDETWGIAKRILKLVQKDGARFDQILVITRSLENYLVPITHIFEENRIPCNVVRDDTLSSLPFARFAYSVVIARLFRLSNSSLFELLSSPFVTPPSVRDFQNLEAILTGLLIRNSEEWDRLKPLLESQELPLIFDFIKPEQLDSFRNTVQYLWELKNRIQNIPENATLPEFATSLRQTLESISRLSSATDGDAVYQLLDRIADYSMLAEKQIELSEFADLFKFYLQRTFYRKEEEDVSAKVIVGDIMQLRGMTADYVFVAGLNNDVFPRRVQEDPFLPDRARNQLQKISGAGPSAKRSMPNRLVPVKEGTTEELLLFSLALRAAKRKLYLSYQRADSSGRKTAASGYLDDLMRVFTGASCDSNPFILTVPKHHKTKFIEEDMRRPDILPNPAECATLTDHFLVPDLADHFYQLPGAYTEHLREFARRMNSLKRNEALPLDGCIPDSRRFWTDILRGENRLRISYSQFKNYLECPFKFFGSTILGLAESPKDSEEEEHDVSQLMKGLISEDVVKRALRYIRDQKWKKDKALKEATLEVREKYAPIFPSLLLDFYLQIFHKGASNLIDYLQQSGFDLSKTEVPDRAQGGEVELLRLVDLGVAIVIKGIPDFVFYKRNGEGTVVDLKWRTKAVTDSLGGILRRNEAQFCIYPAVVQTRTGAYFPFSYYRLDAFASYGSPLLIEQKIREVLVSEPLDVILRTFGTNGSATDCQKYFNDEIQKEGTQLLNGDFRIIEDPSFGFSVCRYCGFTQICRRTHTATLLRSKQERG